MLMDNYDDEGIPSNKDESGFVKTFPQRLMEILSREDTKNSIVWVPDGDAFLIVNQASFVDNVLPRFFKKTKFTSFKGKLYRWGFRRIMKGENVGAYSHKLFVRDQPLLCLHMRRAMKSNAKDCQDNLPPGANDPSANGQPNQASVEQSEAKVKAKPKKPRKPRAKKETAKQPPKKGNNKKTPSQNKAAPTATNTATAAVIEPIVQPTNESNPVSIEISSAAMMPPNNVSYMNNSCSNNLEKSFPMSQQQQHQPRENFYGMTNHRHQQQERPPSVGDITRALVEEGEEMEILGNIQKSTGLELHNHNNNDDWEEAIMSQVMNRLSKSEISPSPSSSVKGGRTNHFSREPVAEMVPDMASMPPQGSGGGYNQVSTSLLAIHRQFFTGLAANFAQQQQRGMPSTALPTDSNGRLGQNDLSFQNALQEQNPNSLFGVQDSMLPPSVSFPNNGSLQGNHSHSETSHYFPPNVTGNNNNPHHLSCDLSVDSSNFSTNSHKLDLLSDAALTFRTPFMQEMRFGDGGDHIVATEDDKPAAPAAPKGWIDAANHQRSSATTTTRCRIPAQGAVKDTRKEIQKRLSAASNSRRNGSIMKSPSACSVKETKGFAGHIV